ncbi:sensor histidine kinase [Mucilaginibacter calamicampi]|uniref:Sensor histidine kinase n=1 Tax=Mucilaginibacter calamicampi TaxID=1302352 RepID=A0ABW2YVU4_9SPHI
MKTLLTFFLSFLAASVCLAQEKRPVRDVDGEINNYSVSSLNSKIQIFLKPDENTKSISPFNYITNDPLGNVVFLEGAKTVTVTTRLYKDSLKYYRYSITENDSTVIALNQQLTKVDFEWNKWSAHPGYATMNFGINNTAGKKVTLRIYCLTDLNKVTTVIIYNKPIKPAQLLQISLSTLNEDKKITYNGLTYNKFKTTAIKDGATITDHGNNVSISLSMKKTDLDFIYNIYVVQRSKDGERIVLQSNAWLYNNDYEGTPGFDIGFNYFRQPGDYEVIIAPGKLSLEQLKNGKTQITKFSLKVLQAPNVYSTGELVVIIIIVVLIIAGIALPIIYLIRKKNKAKLRLADLQADAARNDLNMVRANLNPHFIFNALSGIQSLINKNEVEQANNYLSKFAGLTRHVLNDSLTISIREEISLLNDYLAMEQLRFSFQYQVDADEGVNDNIEIPVMLVQPFVENAVKHGVMPLKGTGDINISFTKQGSDLKITITDNGKGFDANKNHSGLGLKLSKKRIDLLNQTFKECPTMLQITSTASKTSVVIILTQWL